MKIVQMIKRGRRYLQTPKRRVSAPLSAMLAAGDWAGLAKAAATSRGIDGDLAALGARLSAPGLADQPVTVLTPHNLKGNIQHFHHYFGAILLPALLLADMKVIEDGIVLAPDCGDLNDKLAEIVGHMGCRLEVFPLELTEAVTGSPAFRQIDLVPHDKCDVADHVMLPHALARVRRAAFAMAGAPDRTADPTRLLLIDRGPPLAFYSSDRYRNHFNPEGVSGSDRRSIANIDEIERTLAQDWVVQRALPEHMTLREQINCFGNAAFIVAQHGAALNSVLWARAGTVVIEIIPRRKLGQMTFFANLSRACGLRHHLVIQQDAHGPADVAHIRSILLAERHMAPDKHAFTAA